MALDVITWMWGDKYGMRDVVRLFKAVKSNLNLDHRFHVFSDPEYQHLETAYGIKAHKIEDPNLMDRSCYCRLRMFDPRWQQRHGMHGTIVSLDLDVVITGALDPLFTTANTFMILQGANAVNPNPFNASVMLLQSGYHTDVWDSFSVKKASTVPYHEFPDDQGWIWHKLPNAAGWPVGKSGIYAFQKPGWPGWPKGGHDALPVNARLVSFIGRRKPEQYTALPWVRKFWSEAA
jgi:hypothetical protein